MASYQLDIRKRNEEDPDSAPYQWIGTITIFDETDRDQQILASFIENHWARITRETGVATAKSFNLNKVTLWISAEEAKTVAEAMSEVMKFLKTDFTAAKEVLRLRRS